MFNAMRYCMALALISVDGAIQDVLSLERTGMSRGCKAVDFR
jgi:hypothetical protein